MTSFFNDYTDDALCGSQHRLNFIRNAKVKFFLF